MSRVRTPSSPSRLRSPFLVTLSTLSVAGVSLAGGCGGEIVFTETSSSSASGSGGATSSASGPGTTASSSNGTSVGGSTSVSSGVGGSNPVYCPAEPPSVYDTCTIHPDEACFYTLGCQSGPVQLGFICREGRQGWDVMHHDCAYEYDSCPGTELYCSGQWWLPEGTNPPAPCPNPGPAEGSECYSGGFGGVHEKCGYMCDVEGQSVWTVATCTPPDIYEQGVWEYDGACDP